MVLVEKKKTRNEEDKAGAQGVGTVGLCVNYVSIYVHAFSSVHPS